jgi:penicillin-binding protein 1A
LDRNGKELYRSTPFTVCERCTPLETEEESKEHTLVSALFDTNEGVQTLPVAPQVLDPEVDYIVYDMMRDVIKYGTGRRARVLKRDDIAGKTGTTNDGRDAWFSGFNGDVVTTVWSGFDNSQPLGRGEWGGSVSLPTWIEYMRDALANTEPSYIDKPSSLVTVRIDPKTGERALPGQKDAIFEVFREENVPDIKLASAQSGTISSDTSGISDIIEPKEEPILEELF